MKESQHMKSTKRRRALGDQVQVEESYERVGGRTFAQDRDAVIKRRLPLKREGGEVIRVNDVGMRMKLKGLEEEQGVGMRRKLKGLGEEHGAKMRTKLKGLEEEQGAKMRMKRKGLEEEQGEGGGEKRRRGKEGGDGHAAARSGEERDGREVGNAWDFAKKRGGGGNKGDVRDSLKRGKEGWAKEKMNKGKKSDVENASMGDAKNAKSMRGNESDGDEEEEDEEGSEEEEQVEVEESSPKITSQSCAELLVHVADLSNRAMSNDADAIKSSTTVNKKEGTSETKSSALADLISLAKHANFWKVNKAANLSALAVFQDLLPHEYIRELSASEEAVKVTKEVKAVRSVEKALLSLYRSYLNLLFQAVRAGPWEKAASGNHHSRETRAKSKEDRAKAARVAMYCLCNLLEARPMFNFFDEIVAIVVPRTSSPDAKITRICCETLATAVEDDSSFEVALSVAKTLTKLYERKGTISAKALDAFLPLKLNADMKDERRLDLIDKAKKQRRDKRRKLGMDLAKLLEDTDATSMRSHEIFQRQTEIVRELFTLYLRILTNSLGAMMEMRSTYQTITTSDNGGLMNTMLPMFPNRSLVVQALRGAGRLVGLVNIEFVHGVVRILTDMFPSTESVYELDIALQVCETGLHAMSILSRPELRSKVTATEESGFTRLLVRCIARLNTDETTAAYTSAITRCVQALFFRRREADVRVVADFAVRLISAATRVPAHFALALLSIQRSLLERYPGAKELVLGTGKTAEEEPCGPPIPISFSNPDDASRTDFRPAWELCLMSQSHYHISVAKFAQANRVAGFRAVTSQANETGKMEKPLEILNSHDPLDGDLFYPGVSASWSRKRVAGGR